jgi:tagatose 1,6-diphosphate aldolase
MTTLSSWTAARARAVDQLAGPDGVVVGAAVDHRDSMSIALRKRGLPAPTPQGLTEVKLRVASVLAPAASVILLDAEYSAAQALAAGAVPRDTALVVPLEAQGYGDRDDSRRTSFLPGWTPQKAAALGAAGCKLLLPYRPDLSEQHEPQDEVVRAAVDGCRTAGIALVLEPIVYALAGEELDASNFAQLVVDTAAALAPFGPEILKMQYPGSEAACEELDEACGRDVPWVLLGGGAPAEALERQIEQACRAGASGFIVGRTLFDPGLVPDPHESEAALREQSVPMLERFARAARRHARPWRERIGEVPPPPHGWWQD